jgi:heptosyltransferase III
MTSLVYHAGALGDFLTALPAIAAWRRQRAGGGPVVLLGRPAHAVLAAGLVEGAWDAGSARFASLFAGSPSPEVRALLADIDSALVFAPAGAGIVRGLERAGVRGIVRHDPFPKERVHVVDYHLSLFPNLALEPDERVPHVAVGAGGAAAEGGAAAVPTTTAVHEVAAPARPMVIHPGSGSLSKNWPVERFVEIAERLGGETPIVWVIGPAEAESGTAEAIDRAIPGARVWRNLPLSELADRLCGARLFVGNDSGVAHLAAAAGCPVVVMFGASDPVVWAPRGRSVTVLGDGTRGMNAISVEAVLAACRAILRGGIGGDGPTKPRRA